MTKPSVRYLIVETHKNGDITDKFSDHSTISKAIEDCRNIAHLNNEFYIMECKPIRKVKLTTVVEEEWV